MGDSYCPTCGAEPTLEARMLEERERLEEEGPTIIWSGRAMVGQMRETRIVTDDYRSMWCEELVGARWVARPMVSWLDRVVLELAVRL